MNLIFWIAGTIAALWATDVWTRLRELWNAGNYPAILVILVALLVAVLGAFLVESRRAKKQYLPGPQYLDLLVGLLFLLLGIGLYSYAHKTERKVEERNKTIDQLRGTGKIEIPAPTLAKEPEKVVEPDYRGFHFSNLTIVIDLRKRINVPPDMISTRRISPVTRFLFATLERTTEARKPVSFEFATVGKEIELQCLSAHHSNWEFVPDPRMHQHLDETAGKPQTLRGYQLRIKTDEYATNETFLVAAEAFYWNSYQDDKREWSALVAPEKCDSMTIIHLFSPQKPFTKYALREYKHRHDLAVTKDAYSDTPNLIWNPKNTYLSWHIADPKPEYAYDILWEW